MSQLTYSVPSMTCEHCKHAIETEVTKVPGVSSVVVDVEAKSVQVEGAATDEAIRAAIDEAGFDIA